MYFVLLVLCGRLIFPFLHSAEGFVPGQSLVLMEAAFCMLLLWVARILAVGLLVVKENYC